MNNSKRLSFRRNILMFLCLFIFGSGLYAKYELAKAKMLYDIVVLQKLRHQCSEQFLSDTAAQRVINAFIEDPWEKGTADALNKLNFDDIKMYRECLKSGKPSTGEKANGGPPIPSNISESMVSDANGESGLVSSILNPGISEAEILFAITDVLVERAKQELAIAYLDRVTGIFEKPISITLGKFGAHNFYLKDLLPATYMLIRSMPDNLNAQFGNSFKAAMEQDIRDLPNNILNSMPDTVKQSNIYTLADIARFTYNDVRKRIHPAMILNDLDVEFYAKNRPFGNYIHMVNIVSESMLQRGSQRATWYSFRDFEELNLDGWQFYTSLFLTEHKTFLDKTLGEVSGNRSDLSVQSFKNKIHEFQSFVRTVLANLNTLNDIVNRVTETKGSGENIIYYPSNKTNGEPLRLESGEEGAVFDPAIAARQFLDMIKDASDFIQLFHKDEKLAAEVEKYVGLGNTLIDGYEAARQKDYGMVAIKSLEVLRTFAPDSVYSEVIHYITLAADIAQAKSADEVKTIFEAAMLPVGSYRIKRSTKFSVSLNSYVGVQGGLEWADHAAFSQSEQAPFGGLFLPVGLAINCSKGTEKKEANSWSLYFPVLDLGTIASYRLSSGEGEITTETVPEIGFRQVFAPGVYGVFGIKNNPISIGIGGQVAPLLRKINSVDDLDISQAHAYRIGAFIAVDIPVFHFGLRGANN